MRDVVWRVSQPGRRSAKTAAASTIGQLSCRIRNPQLLATSPRSHAAKIDFHCWLQWLMEEQLAGTQQAAGRAGMALGVMHDLPVGVVLVARMPGVCR